MDRLFYVYILVSERDETIHYTGITTDLEQRLRENNRGSCSLYICKSAMANRNRNCIQI